MAYGVSDKPVPTNLNYPAPVQVPVQLMSASGAVTIVGGGVVHITKAGVAAMTLADPLYNGIVLTFASTTAQAHTLTLVSGIGGVGAGADVGTWGGAARDGVTLYSYGGYWWVMPGTNLNVTFA
jgi:hypothetical protein